MMDATISTWICFSGHASSSGSVSTAKSFYAKFQKRVSEENPRICLVNEAYYGKTNH